MAWSVEQKKQWFEEQSIQRSYHEEVVTQIQQLSADYQLEQYGALSIDPARYPLFYLRSQNWQSDKPTILITGGVHGYETSGVHGALRTLKELSQNTSQDYQVICFPCLSPWAYETINRWNPLAIDPNRSFYKESPSEECAFFLKAVAPFQDQLLAHFDLHETTDTDNSVFRPALEQRDGIPQEVWDIPDGFYLVGDSDNPQHEFQKAIIAEVEKVTHIAPADEQGKIIGEAITQNGVINYPLKSLFLCAGFSKAPYTTTTEVYPDSPKATPEQCILAQVAAVRGGLHFLSEGKIK